MLQGRRESISILRSKRHNPLDRWIWIHVASLGEFEQARPLIERIHTEHPEYKIALTFFSPSGYNQIKDYPLVDLVTYLPFDTSRKLRPFIELLNPELVVFIKYEFWLNTLSILREKQVPTYLVSAIFREDQPFFKPITAKIFRKGLETFRKIFVQNSHSVKLLEQIGFTQNVVLAGDTRIDRVIRIQEQGQKIPKIEQLAKTAHQSGMKVVACGSTWPADEELLIPLLLEHRAAFPIIIPHEIGEAHIEQIITLSKGRATRYSQWDGSHPKQIELLIVDQIGLLSSLYRYADIAYIGGGFGRGIHNTLEAAVYSVPVIFGPKYQKFAEAHALIKSGGGFSIQNGQELSETLETLLTDATTLKHAGDSAGAVVLSQAGATDKILQGIFTRE